ncbi:MAG: class I SAM-dependent methyltransferase [Bacteroidetes bacterium]|nr:class I SAM-dependent methyltransferase [Bacteroidota bacterium]
MPELHYSEQVNHAEKYFLPYLNTNVEKFEKFNILEIGCAEAGVLDLLHKRGHSVTGLEIDKNRAGMAKSKNESMNIVVGDISSKDIVAELNTKFDLIIMREVIEHVSDKDSTFKNLNELLKEGGYLFMSFPPKYSPFAGHQQVGKSFMKKTPYIHLLPLKILELLSRKLQENVKYPAHLKTNYSTGMSIRKFEKFTKKYNWQYIVKEHFLLRPIYNLRFGTPIVKVIGLPLLREVYVLGYETLMRKK